MIGDAATQQMNPKEHTNRVAGPGWLLPASPRTDERQRQPTDVGDFELRQTTLRLMRGENLSRVQAENFLGALLNPTATDAQVAAALAVLAVKGETVEELAGMAEAMRNRAIPVRCHHKRFIDTAGTGSSGAKTFNVSTGSFRHRRRRFACRKTWFACGDIPFRQCRRARSARRRYSNSTRNSRALPETARNLFYVRATLSRRDCSRRAGSA